MYQYITTYRCNQLHGLVAELHNFSFSFFLIWFFVFATCNLQPNTRKATTSAAFRWLQPLQLVAKLYIQELFLQDLPNSLMTDSEVFTYFDLFEP
jgi:hypothetical protein